MPGRDMTIRGPYLRSPSWMGDIGHPEALLPAGMKLDAAQFRNPDAILVKINNGAGYAAGVTSITVDALISPNGKPNPIIPNGASLDFGGAKLVIVNDAAVNAADIAITVRATPTALVDNDEAYYAGVLRKSLPSGIAVGRTYAERDANTPYGPADAADDEIYLVAFDIEDLAVVPDAVAYRPGHVVYENFLPEFATLAAGVRTALRAKYHMQIAEP